LSFGVIPKEIESKNDYLFYGNIKYSTDETDEKFKDFDARCFNDGNYYYDGDTKVDKIYHSDKINNVPDHNVMHKELSSNKKEYDPDNWKTDEVYSSGEGGSYYYNGYGKCLAWKYTYKKTYNCNIF